MRTLLKNGRIMDGSGEASFVGSVILKDDIIDAVVHGEVTGEFDGKIIDSAGKVIAPGFIDAHSHNDWFAARQNPLPYFKPFVEQGITAQVTGNCGFSPFGYEANTPHTKELTKNLFERGDAEGDFSTFGGWLVEAQKRVPLTLIPLQGHGAVRTGISGYANRPLTDQELLLHDAKIEESFDQGVFGLSFGLMYEPDRYAPPEELERAARLAAKRGGILTVHERACSAASTSYSPPFGGRPHNLRALDEMIELAKKTGVRLQYSHLIYVGESSWKTVDESLELIDKARAQGVDIAYDLYSMTFGVSVITVVLPSWYLSLPEEKKHSKIIRARLAVEIGVTKRALGFGFGDIQIAWLGPGHDDLRGKRISEIAREWQVPEIDAYLKLVEMSGATGRVNMYRYYNEDIIAKLTKHEPSLFMTDAWIEDFGVQNASCYSSFPRFLQNSREGRGIPMEKAVRKMSGAVADRFGIRLRGYLREGYPADVTVFNPGTIASKGDSAERPVGIEHVFVNGRHVVSDGAAEDSALLGAGMVLKRV